jgi:hypothetical protein
MAGLFKKVDQLVYPGRDSKEATDTMSAPERFAMCAVGTHGGTSGYSRMSTLRTKAGVKKEYDTLQLYQCVICQRNLASNLALRPPVDNMRLFVPGEARLTRGEPMKYLGVFSDAHATQLNSGGFTQVVIRFHPPDVVLPLEEIGELSEQGSGSVRPRKRRGLPVADPVVQASSRAQELAREQGTHDKAREGALQKLKIPPNVPTWTGCKQLVAMMEEPFTLDADSHVFYSPVYMWPSRQKARKNFSAPGEGWHRRGTGDALSRLYQDYYNLVARNDQAFAALSSDKNGKRPQIVTAQNLLDCDPLPTGVLSFLRSHQTMSRDKEHATWAAAVVSHIKNVKRENFKDPFE